MTKKIPPGRGNPGWERKRDLLGEKSELTIFDIGANTGTSAIAYRELFPEAKIHSFEPTPKTFETLASKVDSDPLSHATKLAFSCSPGTGTFNVYPNSATNSLLPMRAPETWWPGIERVSSTRVETIEVLITTLDLYTEQENISRIDLLKTDTQGHDLNVLKGAAHLLANKKIGLLYVEAIFVPHYEGQDQFHDLTSYLFGHDYHLYDLFDCARREDGQLAWANALFLPGQKVS